MVSTAWIKSINCGAAQVDAARNEGGDGGCQVAAAQSGVRGRKKKKTRAQGVWHVENKGGRTVQPLRTRDLVGCRGGRPSPGSLGAAVVLGLVVRDIAWVEMGAHVKPLRLAWNWLNGVAIARRMRAGRGKQWRRANSVLQNLRHHCCAARTARMHYYNL